MKVGPFMYTRAVRASDLFLFLYTGRECDDGCLWDHYNDAVGCWITGQLPWPIRQFLDGTKCRGTCITKTLSYRECLGDAVLSCRHSVVATTCRVYIGNAMVQWFDDNVPWWHRRWFDTVEMELHHQFCLQYQVAKNACGLCVLRYGLDIVTL